MTWLTPALAAVAASIAIPALLILYFLKLRRRDVEISTTLLWKRAIEDLQANAPFQRLRRNLLLFLQLLALGAALAAVAQPQIQASSTTGQRHLIVIDTSASMSAADARNARGETVSRLEAAKEQAIELVRSLREPGPFDREGGDRAMVIAFDKSARAVQPFTPDKRTLISAIESIQPTDSPTSVSEAYQLVRAQAPRITRTEVITREDGSSEEQTYDLPEGPVGTIHLFSDGRLSDPAAFTPRPEDGFVYHALGTADAPNVGITSLRADRAFDNPDRLSIFVGLQSTDTQARTVEVELALGQDVVQIKAVDMPAAGSGAREASGQPGGTRTPSVAGIVFTLDRPQGAIVTVRLSPGGPDVLRTDDTAWLVVPPAKKMAVGVVTRGNLFLSAALEGLPLARLERFEPDVFAGLLRAGRTGEFDVIILDGLLPEPQPEIPLPPGRYLIFNAVPSDAGVGVLAEVRNSVVIDWSRDHPALRGLSLDSLFISRSRKLELQKGGGARTLVTSDQGPEVVEIATDRARAIVAGFDPADSNWPFNVSFVVFLASAVQYLGADATDGVGLGRIVQPGDHVSERLPPDAADVRLRGPGTDASLSPAPDGRVVFGPIRTAGLYQLAWRGQAGATDAQSDGRAVRPFAANLLSPAESDVPALRDLALGSRVVQSAGEGPVRVTRRLWPWLLLAALGIILFEWFIYNRKVHL